MEEKDQLEDKHEFFEFMRGERKFEEKREKLREFKSLQVLETELIKRIYKRESKLENLIETQSKNVSFLNSMIKKSGMKKEDDFIQSPYLSFRVQTFKERIRSMKEECEKYFDAIDLTLVLKGKKNVKRLVEELDIDYDAWEQLKNDRGMEGKEVLFSRVSNKTYEQVRAKSGKY